MGLKELAKMITGRITLFGSTSLTSESGVGIPIIIEATGEIKNVNYGKAGSTVTAFATESSGEQKESLYGKASGTLTAFKVETTGEQDNVFHGKDSGGNIDPFRTNENQQLFYELFENWKQVDPYLMTGSDAIAYNPGSTASETYSVTITVYNLTGGAVNATVYVDVAAGGSAGNGEYLMNAESVATKTRITLPEIIIGGDDDIRAVAGAVDSIAMHFKVKQVTRT